jgi:hypothetical protein
LSNFATPATSAPDLLEIEELLKENLISGFVTPNGSGFPVFFNQIRITIKGRKYLEELELKEAGEIALPAKIEKLNQQIKEMEQSSIMGHTLWNYWKLADWSGRFGMISFFGFILVVGYLCSKAEAVSRFIDLIRSIKP